jgi:hypothetical protein
VRVAVSGDYSSSGRPGDKLEVLRVGDGTGVATAEEIGIETLSNG